MRVPAQYKQSGLWLRLHHFPQDIPSQLAGKIGEEVVARHLSLVPRRFLERWDMRYGDDVWVTVNRFSQHRLKVPSSFFGWLYWLCLLPFHIYVFRGMLRQFELKTRASVAAECGQPES